MSYTTSSLTSTITDSLSVATATGIDNAATAVPAHLPAPKNQGSQTTQNIVFGVFAIVLALGGILVAWLQLRSFQRGGFDEERPVERPQYELVEV